MRDIPEYPEQVTRKKGSFGIGDILYLHKPIWVLATSTLLSSFTYGIFNRLLTSVSSVLVLQTDSKHIFMYTVNTLECMYDYIIYVCRHYICIRLHHVFWHVLLYIFVFYWEVFQVRHVFGYLCEPAGCFPIKDPTRLESADLPAGTQTWQWKIHSGKIIQNL